MRFFKDNGLSIVLCVLFAITLAGQAVAGFRHENEERREHGQSPQAFSGYLRSPAFLEATAENWESEFLQMGFYVLLTVFLFQKGSAESKDPDKKEEVDRDPDPHRKGAPWPVKRGGIVLRLYSHSLLIAFLLLFLLSFAMHAIGGAGEYNEEQRLHDQPERVSVIGYMRTSRFWFESLQNWQSEFLAVLSIVVLSIFLRQHGSPESKPIDAAHSETGS
jgi:hypothetical protein